MTRCWSQTHILQALFKFTCFSTQWAHKHFLCLFLDVGQFGNGGTRPWWTPWTKPTKTAPGAETWTQSVRLKRRIQVGWVVVETPQVTLLIPSLLLFCRWWRWPWRFRTDHPLILWRGAAGGAPALRRKGLPQRARFLPRFLPLERELFLATVASGFDQVRTRLHASVSFVAGLDCKWHVYHHNMEMSWSAWLALWEKTPKNSNKTTTKSQ